jgi:hypothetical protein
MAFLKGRGVTVEVAATYSGAKTVSAVTKANPGVATSTSHGLADGTCGYFGTVSGMAQLTNQGCMTDNAASDTFELAGLNTTNYATFSSTASFTAVATWATLSECDSYDIGGGSGDKIDVTCLIDITKKEEQGNLPAQSVTLNIKSTDVPSAAMLLVIAAAQSGSGTMFRISTQGATAYRVFYGEPSLPGESVQTGAVGTGNLSVAVKGYVVSAAAPA